MLGFRSTTEAIDTTTPGGRLLFHLFGALGQFERDLIRERTRAGLAAAPACGRKGRRKPVVDAEKLMRARSMIAKGLTARKTALRLKIGKTALYGVLRAAAPRSIPIAGPRLSSIRFQRDRIGSCSRLRPRRAISQKPQDYHVDANFPPHLIH